MNDVVPEFHDSRLLEDAMALQRELRARSWRRQRRNASPEQDRHHSDVHPVHALATGHPILSTEVEIFEAETTTLDLQLEHGPRVVGVVRDEDGAPIERAILLALDAPFDDPFPTRGPTEAGVPFRRPGVRSKPDGSFVLAWMPLSYDPDDQEEDNARQGWGGAEREEQEEEGEGAFLHLSGSGRGVGRHQLR